MKTREASLCILSTRHLTDDPVDMKHGLSHFFRATRSSRDNMLVSLHSPPLPSHIATHIHSKETLALGEQSTQL